MVKPIIKEICTIENQRIARTCYIKTHKSIFKHVHEGSQVFSYVGIFKKYNYIISAWSYNNRKLIVFYSFISQVLQGNDESVNGSAFYQKILMWFDIMVPLLLRHFQGCCTLSHILTHYKYIATFYTLHKIN